MVLLYGSQSECEPVIRQSHGYRERFPHNRGSRLVLRGVWGAAAPHCSVVVSAAGEKFLGPFSLVATSSDLFRHAGEGWSRVALGSLGGRGGAVTSQGRPGIVLGNLTFFSFGDFYPGKFRGIKSATLQLGIRPARPPDLQFGGRKKI